MDLSWLCFAAVALIMIPVIYYGVTARLSYAKQLPEIKPKTRFATLDEFYKAVSVLIEWLKRDGHLEEAQKLDLLMHTAWTTASEWSGELMLTLKSMKGNYSPELKKEINQCFEFALRHRKFLEPGDGPFHK